MRRHLYGATALVLTLAAVAGCAAGRAFGRGEQAARAGDWDEAVAHYQKAVQASPERADYKIALERAMLSASHVHLDQARALEARDDLQAAAREYRRASEYDPSNRQAATKAIELEQTIRDRLEAARPRAPIDELREKARQAAAEPVLNPASREPLRVNFSNANVRDILNFIAGVTGINITYDKDMVEGRPYTIEAEGVTLEQALNLILTANGLFYKVLNERTIIVIPDNPQKRQAYEEQVIQTFYVSHADATELATTLNQIFRTQGMTIIPIIAANKTANTIMVKASAAVASIIERVIEVNDKPRAEVVIDVEILEVNRERLKKYGIDLSNYSISGMFSPEAGQAADAAGGGAFNANTISRGVSASDFYLTVPSAVLNFLEGDSQSKLIAKPQLRGQEGTKLTLNLGDDVPVPSTTFTPIATGGSAFNPLVSFSYRKVGVNVEVTPRVTFEGDIILELMVESSSIGQTVPVGGQDLQSFGSRQVQTKLRLRDGESNLLAGLLREDTRKSLRGVTGLARVPILSQLFAANDDQIRQTDIVMLLTPRIVRTHELSQRDVSPIYIGTQQSFGLGGPPPLIAPTGSEAGAAAAQPPPAATPPFLTPPGATPPATPPAGAEPPKPVVPEPVKPLAPPPAQVLVTPPGPEFRVGGGPYTVPISISNVSRVTTITLTVSFPAALLRVQAVQEGSFMRQGGAMVAFAQQVDAATGRIDITLNRAGDLTGAAGTGLLASVLLDAVSPGAATLTVSGVATAPDGAALPLQFTAASVTVR